MEYKDKNEVREIIEARLIRHKTTLESWERVKRAYKKDGTEYKRLCDTFRSAFFTDYGNYYEIKVICQDINGKIFHSRITVEKVNITPEKIEKAIQEKKNRLKETIQKDEAELITLDERIEELNELITPLKDYLNSLIGTVDNLRLYEEYTQFYLNK